MTYKSGEKYTGSWKGDHPNGRGMFTFENGDKYVGEWKNGKKEGKGLFTWNDGDRFEGNFVNDLKEGFGKMIFKNGNKFEGNFKKDVIEGDGKMIYNDKSKYDGQWKNGLKNGKGIFTFSNGDKYDGNWTNDVIEGKGIYTYKSGGKYNGNFVNGIKEGKGVMIYPSGNKYDGNFNNDKPNGIGIITLISTIIFSIYGKKTIKMIPFILGILVGYAFAAIFTLIGNLAHVDALKIIDFSSFNNIKWIPDFAFVSAFKGFADFENAGQFFKYFGVIALGYIPVAFVVFAEHIADHKNLSSIIDVDLLEDPGLHRSLLGDGVGSFAGALFGGCPNTTYGESIACVAISGNASTWVTLATGIMAIVVSFFGPFVTFLATIPKCVMGGICMSLYGFIAVSGLKMLKGVDLGDNRNVFVISAILIAGVGGLVLRFAGIEITEVAVALIVGIIINVIVHIKEQPTESGGEEQ